MIVHIWILLDREIVVNGVVLGERKELKNISDDDGNQENSILIHPSRYIHRQQEIQRRMARKMKCVLKKV